ncbi:hypothetical protein Tco_1050739, partial [Tanacetum coccineum]
TPLIMDAAPLIVYAAPLIVYAALIDFRTKLMMHSEFLELILEESLNYYGEASGGWMLSAIQKRINVSTDLFYAIQNRNDSTER